MTFDEAQAYLLGTISETVSVRTSYKLDRMAALLRELGEPHRAYPTIHIGGTSGKSSTSAMIAAALQAAGKRTGLHTKPHLHSVTERAQIDGGPVSEERFAHLLREMMPAIERTTAAHGRPTYYETLLALAFTYFARERVDVAVIEVGLGGRLDGTNVIVPAVAAITSIGYDHTDVLGNTLEAIAMEKAGIAKFGVPLVVGNVPAEAAITVERYAASAGAPVLRTGDYGAVENARDEETTQAFDVRTPHERYAIRTRALGRFQRDNALTAVTVLEQLPAAIRTNAAAVEDGFARLAIPGRMEVFAGKPVVVFDVAHNVEKAEHLVTALRERFGPRRLHYVVAIGESKDARGIVEALIVPGATFCFTAFSVPGRQSLKPARLSAAADSLGIHGRSIENPVEALRVVMRDAAPDAAIVVTGSTFVVAEVREWYATIAAR